MEINKTVVKTDMVMKTLEEAGMHLTQQEASKLGPVKVMQMVREAYRITNRM